jgi:quinoprotein glucose dehydrogenase
MRHILSLIVLLCVSTAAIAAQPPAPPSFTAPQAEAGRSVYARHCAICHGGALEGGAAGPALLGSAFLQKWRNRWTQLFEQTRRTMPVTQPGTLPGSDYESLAALMLSVNGQAPGRERLALGAFEPPIPDAEWLHHRGDPGSLNYSPLAQIRADNIARLRVAWRWRTDNFGAAIWPNFEVTPLMVGGVLYATAGASRSVVAIDAKSGETLWMYRLDEGQRGENAPRKGPGRGLALWRDGTRERLFLITPGYQLVALDAATGRPVPNFGTAGIVDLKRAADPPLDPVSAPIGSSSPPVVVGNVVIVGSAFGTGAAPPRKEMPTGNVMAFDARTGKRLWVFHTIARAGSPGGASWTDEARAWTGNTGVWAPFSADVERGLVYLPVEAPTSDFYGGHRPGGRGCRGACAAETPWALASAR